MPSYIQSLIQEQLKQLDGAIDTFLDGYRDWGIARGDKQRTVIFFPGGLASELTRAHQPFDPTGGTAYTYRQIWYDIGLIRGPDKAALRLAMRREADSEDYDEFKQFVVASGPMDNCFYRPYDGFVDWCRQNDLNLLIFSWDFRRKGEWVVDLFLDHFLDYVRSRAPGRGINPAVNDPLASVSLVGHSFGGMLVKWIANRHDHPLCQNMQLAVTVGTPFYGYGSQIHRMFEGDPDVGGNYMKSELSKAIATMPGGYSLFYLDSQTYDDNRLALQNDLEYPLHEYPCLDATDFSRVDPYHPATRGVERRYHEFGWDLAPYIADGFNQYKLMPKPLDDSIKQRFHCVRGVQTNGGPGGPDHNGTTGSVRWQWIRNTFDPDSNPSPILDGPKEPGDGTIPAWSARLVTLNEDHIHTIKGEVEGEEFEHMFLMEQAGVLSKLLELLDTRQGERESRVVMLRRNFAPAPIDEFNRVSRELARLASIEPREAANQAIGDFVQSMEPNRRAALVKRWFIEMARGPRSLPR